MKKVRVFLPLLAAFLLLSALPAFSGSGPYGNYGPSDNAVVTHGVAVPHTALAGGSGPYGAFGPTFKGVGTPQVAVVSGTGPYGAFDSSGMIAGLGSRQTENKTDCMLAKNCP